VFERSLDDSKQDLILSFLNILHFDISGCEKIYSALLFVGSGSVCPCITVQFMDVHSHAQSLLSYTVIFLLLLLLLLLLHINICYN
jgi:hypothetical protein